MQVWTAQPLGFDLCGGLFDRTKSDSCGACTLPDHEEAYKFLHDALGTERVVWCVPDKPEDVTERSKTLWRIDVPDDKFADKKVFSRGWAVAIVDSAVWNKMCGNTQGCLTGPIKRKLEEKCLLEAKHQVDKAGQLFDEKLRRLRDLEPFDGLCERLFIADPTAIFANILLRHPIPQDWIGPQDTQA